MEEYAHSYCVPCCQCSVIICINVKKGFNLTIIIFCYENILFSDILGKIISSRHELMCSTHKDIFSAQHIL